MAMVTKNRLNGLNVLASNSTTRGSAASGECKLSIPVYVDAQEVPDK